MRDLITGAIALFSFSIADAKVIQLECRADLAHGRKIQPVNCDFTAGVDLDAKEADIRYGGKIESVKESEPDLYTAQFGKVSCGIYKDAGTWRGVVSAEDEHGYPALPCKVICEEPSK